MALQTLDSGVRDVLEWNKRKVLSYLCTIDEHLSELKSEEVPHSWCLVKHYLLTLDHHLHEAIGHAIRSGEEEFAEKVRRFRQKVEDLNAYPEPHITNRDIVKLRDEWRFIISDPTLKAPCPICEKDVSPEVLKLLDELKTKYHLRDGSLAEIEDEMADRMLTFLSQKHGVPKPTLAINPLCHTPHGVHIEVKDEVQERPDLDKIVLCRGGVNALTLSHEFGHYLDHVKNMPVTEPSAEKFALREVAHGFGREKLLNTKTHKLEGSDRKMATYREIGVIYGSSHVAKGAERGFVEIDKAMGRSAMKPHLRASTWLNIGLGVGLPLLSLHRAVREPLDIALVAAGAHMSTKVWDYAEEYLVTAAALPAVARFAQGAVAPRYLTQIGEFKPRAAVPAAAAKARYTVHTNEAYVTGRMA